MKTMGLLRELRALGDLIRETELTLAALADSLPESPLLTGLPGARGQASPVERRVLRREKLTELLARRKKAYAALSETADRRLEALPPKARELARLYYREGFSQRECAELCGISERHARRLLTGAVRGGEGAAGHVGNVTNH